MSIFDTNKSYDFGDFLPNILKLGINPTQSQLNSIISFFELLVNENKSFNLTSIVEWEPFLLRHILDSACLNLVFSENTGEYLNKTSTNVFPYSKKEKITELPENSEQTEIINSEEE